MNKDKRTLYVISVINFALLFSALFINIGKSSRIVAACVLVPLAVINFLLIKKRRSLSINKKEVLTLMSVVAVLYVVIIQMTGLFFRFYKNPYFVDTERLLNTVIPLILIIAATEVIRYVALAQSDRFAGFMVYLTCVVSETLTFSNLVGITGFNHFMDLIGLTLFPAISANALYHYVSKRYGMAPVISYRMIMTLYIYFLPAKTGMEDALQSCIKIVFPIIMLAFVAALFEKQSKRVGKKSGAVGKFCSVVAIAFVVLVAMLVSNQFRFGALVIATDSMTGEINKGDVVIYERYETQRIEEGQVIVFKDQNTRIVHRVVRIDNIGGELRYYTKGDANNGLDIGYRVESDIVGLVNVKLAYVGYPTLMIRELIEN